MCRHFKGRGAGVIRTLVDRQETGVTGFLDALGFKPSPLQALEIEL
jgi:hypothetical protein